MDNARKTRTKKEDIGYGYDSIFPGRLRGLLEGTTQDKLAEYVGIARQSVAQWKDGKTKPDIYYLGKIANFFGVSTDYLLGRAEKPTPEMTDIHRVTSLSTKAIERLIYWNEGQTVHMGTGGKQLKAIDFLLKHGENEFFEAIYNYLLVDYAFKHFSPGLHESFNNKDEYIAKGKKQKAESEDIVFETTQIVGVSNLIKGALKTETSLRSEDIHFIYWRKIEESFGRLREVAFETEFKVIEQEDSDNAKKDQLHRRR